MMRNRRKALGRACAVLGLAAMVACAGRSTGPMVGGESHFLYRCASSCAGGLECISGVCTKPCIVGESNCSGLAADAICTNESVEPGAVAVCDVACASDGDCSALGDGHGCDLGYCRAPVEPLSGGGTGGSGGTASEIGGTAGSSSVAGPTCETAIVASPEKNYEFASSISVDSVFVKPETDLTFDWSGVTTDFRGRPVDLDTVDMVEIALWEETLDSFAQKLNDDTLANPIVIMHIPVKDGQTTGTFFGAEVPAGPLDENTFLNYLSIGYYPPANHMYSVMVATGNDYGQGTYMLGAFQLDPDSDNTTVTITSTSTHLAYSANIASRPATYVPPGVAGLSINWTNMRVTAAGNVFTPSSITQLRIGAYTQSAAELEGAAFNHLDEIAVEMYEAAVDLGTKISLEPATTRDGKAFAGIDATHTWLLALNCTACQNPAPWYLTVLKPCP